MRLGAAQTAALLVAIRGQTRTAAVARTLAQLEAKLSSSLSPPALAVSSPSLAAAFAAQVKLAAATSKMAIMPSSPSKEWWRVAHAMAPFNVSDRDLELLGAWIEGQSWLTEVTIGSIKWGDWLARARHQENQLSFGGSGEGGGRRSEGW